MSLCIKCANIVILFISFGKLVLTERKAIIFSTSIQFYCKFTKLVIWLLFLLVYNHILLSNFVYLTKIVGFLV